MSAYSLVSFEEAEVEKSPRNHQAQHIGFLFIAPSRPWHWWNALVSFVIPEVKVPSPWYVSCASKDAVTCVMAWPIMTNSMYFNSNIYHDSDCLIAPLQPTTLPALTQLQGQGWVCGLAKWVWAGEALWAGASEDMVIHWSLLHLQRSTAATRLASSSWTSSHSTVDASSVTMPLLPLVRQLFLPILP